MMTFLNTRHTLYWSETKAIIKQVSTVSIVLLLKLVVRSVLGLDLILMIFSKKQPNVILKIKI